MQSGRYIGISGRILTTIASDPTYIEYGIRWDPDEGAVGLLVKLRQGWSKLEMRLERDSLGHWRRDGQVVQELDGVIEPDLEFSPATNTLPIRRLNLAVGSSTEVDAAWIRLPDLSVHRLDQRYTRTSEHGYRYESGGGEFTANLTVDQEGLVIAYGDIWQRVDS